MDITCALIGIVLGFPVLGLLAVQIKVSSTGPAVYASTRVGKDGRPFQLYKFRTMVVDAAIIGGPSAGDDDPRITKTGRFLRKYKLDELPQLFNVLKGDMSFVGPRPEVQHYVDMYTEEENLILSIRPGITDWASLWNSDEGAVLAGSDDPDRTYLEKLRPEKIKLQLDYVRNRTFWSDIVIMLQTAVPMFSKAKPKALSVLEDNGLDSNEKPI